MKKSQVHAELEGPDTLVFLYGTLMSGECRNGLMSHPRTRMIGEDTVKGAMYSVRDAYPAIDLGAEGTIKGEVWSVPEDIIAHILDHIEGYDPQSPDKGLYLRRPTVTGSGREVQLYTAGPRLKSFFGQMERIESGDWRSYLLSIL